MLLRHIVCCINETSKVVQKEAFDRLVNDNRVGSYVKAWGELLGRTVCC